MKFYGILVNGKAVGFRQESNGDQEYCGEYSVYLELDVDNVWLVKSSELAEKAMKESTNWYNSSFESPVNYFIGKAKMEVFEVEIPSK